MNHLRVVVRSSLALFLVIGWGSIAHAAGTGLKGDYFSDKNFTTLASSRTDSTVNFNWTASPATGVVFANGFSVRWTGTVQAQFSETYTFYTQSASGVKLWVSGQIIDKWGSHNSEEDSGTISLTAGKSYFIRMEIYYDGNGNGGTAVAQLKWSSPSTPKAIIPQQYLSPAATAAGWSPVWTNWNPNYVKIVTTSWAAEVSPTNALPEYPRPQMVRPNWLNLNGLWQYSEPADLNTVPHNQTLPMNILVPYPVQSCLSGIAHNGVNSNPQYLWYRTAFTVPAGWAGQHVVLNFGAVAWQSTVYVNGTNMGTHTGSYDGFGYDVTSALAGTGAQELIVGVYAPFEKAAGEPHGKAFLGPPYKYFYSAAAGIWQTAWLEPVPAASIGSLVVTPDVDNQSVHVKVNVAGSASGLTVQTTASFAGQANGSISGAPGADLVLPLSSLKLWSPNAPNLYDLSVTLLNGATTVDTVTSYFGMRKISVGTWTDGKTRILLNNQFTFFIGMLDQGYWADGIYTPPVDAANVYDIQTIKSMGFNMVRKHQKVESERWYYWADKLGLMVFQDMPQAGEYSNAVDTADFTTELQAMVQGRFNHPSIGMWTIFNEGWGLFNAAALTTQVQTWDPSRLVDSNSGTNLGGDPGGGSVIDLHDYRPTPVSPTPSAARAAVLGEFGGVGLIDSQHSWSGATGYGSVNSGAALASDYATQVNTLVTQVTNPGLSAATYTGTTDVEYESIGLMYYDRELKVDASQILAANVLLAPAPPPKPVITSNATAGGAAHQLFTYQIMATNGPTSFGATGLPANLSIDINTGVISGTPNVASSTDVTISATNNAGTGTATLTITINPPPTDPPVINSSLAASGTTSQAFSYQITATNSPYSYNATGLPDGLTVNTSTGAITGTASAVGVTNVMISATNVVNTGSATLVITITRPAKTWTGATSIDWITGTNWTGGVAPTTGDDVILTGTGNNRPANQNIASLSINSLTFDSTITNQFTVNGNSITLTSTGTALKVDVAPMSLNNTTDISISCNIILGNRQTWNVTAGIFDTNYAHVPTSIFTVSGVVSDGGNHYGLIKDGAGSVVLAATNTFTGVITVLGGQLVVSSDNNLGPAPAVPTPGSIVLNGGTLWATTGFTLNPNRGIALGPDSGIGSGNMAVHYDQTMTCSGIIADNVGGIGGFTLIPVGTRPPFIQGVLILSGANTYSGDTHIANVTSDLYGDAGGELQVGAANAIPTGTGKGNVVVDHHAFLALTSYDATINGLSGSGWIDTSSARTLTVGNNNATSTFSGILQNSNGSLSLTKIGTGTLTIAPCPDGPNSYSGATAVNAGVLSVTGSIGGSGVTVNGGTLSGTGTVRSAITVPATKAGNISPGTTASTGILATGNVIFGDSNASFTVRLNGATAGTGYDQLQVNGSITLNNCTLIASLGGGYSPAAGDSLTIITANSAIGGTFNGLAEGTTAQFSGYQCKISYASNKVVLSNFTAVQGAAAKLAFSQQPTNTIASQSISPAITVLVQDANGNTMTGNNSSVTLAIGTNPGGGTLSGTKTVAAVNGLAAFSGLSIDNTGTGYTLTASANGLTPAASSAFNITSATPAPVITSSTMANATVGVPFTYNITASNNPNSYNATSLPAWLSINTGTGALTGTPTATGTPSVSISATNTGGTGPAVTLTITISSTPPPAPVITSATTANATVGVPFTYNITASNSPNSYNATSLPAWLSINSSTGALTGTPLATGAPSISISATNTGGTSSVTLVLTINVPNHAPVVSSVAASANPAQTGSLVTFTATATDPDNDALTYAWNFGDGATGTGNPASYTYAQSGDYTVTASVSDSKGSMVAGTLALSVEPTGIPMTVKKVSGSVLFGASDKDTARASGTILNLPQGFDPAAGAITVYIEGVTASFTLNSRGVGESLAPLGSFKLALKRRKGVVQSGPAAFRVSLKGAFAAEWANKGIDPAVPETNTLFKPTVNITMPGGSYFARPSSHLTVIPNKKARFHYPAAAGT